MEKYNIRKIPFPNSKQQMESEQESEKEFLVCEFCSNELEDKYKWTIQIKYSAFGYNKFNSCKGCIQKMFKEPIQRMNFLQELVNFRKECGFNCWEPWSKKDVQNFVDILKNKKIEILDYGIPIYTKCEHRQDTPIFLHKIAH